MINMTLQLQMESAQMGSPQALLVHTCIASRGTIPATLKNVIGQVQQTQLAVGRDCHDLFKPDGSKILRLCLFVNEVQ
eukprot:m.25349 g.25349  ORF g.25349 m.25349 type:complete len:78 (+) comp13174_c0_seq2:1902-2135(+)